jgi:hypothetical protein
MGQVETPGCDDLLGVTGTIVPVLVLFSQYFAIKTLTPNSHGLVYTQPRIRFKLKDFGRSFWWWCSISHLSWFGTSPLQRSRRHASKMLLSQKNCYGYIRWRHLVGKIL